MPIQPINRPDGRHWCNPASASHEESPVTCTCGRVWFLNEDGVWTEKVD